ncbi:hypothetical protein B0J13DRAFT_234451 [Dactylonectria estremocensis]|uniref:Uncharacterized protein n=1 Tax=Dactylonectria estremocensis TaxID=1079267 RepID=A0A9P9J802_9HYPO|nr:hypothetical protein B0J13DRAFT_234451 [Dactylonectria estremocensis]
MILFGLSQRVPRSPLLGAETPEDGGSLSSVLAALGPLAHGCSEMGPTLAAAHSRRTNKRRKRPEMGGHEGMDGGGGSSTKPLHYQAHASISASSSARAAHLSYTLWPTSRHHPFFPNFPHIFLARLHPIFTSADMSPCPDKSPDQHSFLSLSVRPLDVSIGWPDRYCALVRFRLAQFAVLRKSNVCSVIGWDAIQKSVLLA